MYFCQSEEKEKHKRLSREPAEREAWDETRGRLKAKQHELTCESPRGKGSMERERGMERERKLALAVTYIFPLWLAGVSHYSEGQATCSCCLGFAVGFEWHLHINFSELIYAHWRQKKTFYCRRNWNEAPMPDWQACLMLWANNAIYIFAFLKFLLNEGLMTTKVLLILFARVPLTCHTKSALWWGEPFWWSWRKSRWNFHAQ